MRSNIEYSCHTITNIKQGCAAVVTINDLIDHKCLSIRAENWWHISTKKPPNIGSSSAISEPIIAGLVSARGLPNPMKLGNQLHPPTQTG